MSCTHAKRPVPTDPVEKARYYWAKRQTAEAQEQGMGSDEIHALFKYIMEMDIDAIEKSGTEETYETFRRAIGQATTALDEGKPVAVALNLFRTIMHGDLK